MDKYIKSEAVEFNSSEALFRNTQLNLYINEPEQLMCRHIQFLLQYCTAQDDEVFAGIGGININAGMAVMSMRRGVQNISKLQQFTLSVTLMGEPIGELTGSYAVQYKEKVSTNLVPVLPPGAAIITTPMSFKVNAVTPVK